MSAIRISLALCALHALPTAATADTLNVPGTFPTIQAALDAAGNGDQVLVAPGIYPENILFPLFAVHLTSEAGPEATIIDGGQLGSVVHFPNGCPDGALLEGFTVTNGLAAFGAGVSCAPNAQPTIRGNHIIFNQATYDGGGIFPRPENRVTIEGNLIGWNTAVGQAGGLQAPASDSIVRNNILVGNVATHGGAYFSRVESTVTMVNCTFFGNEAPNGSLASGDGGLTLVNCVVDGHDANPFAMFGGGSVNAIFSTIPSGTGQAWFGTGCIDADPRLADPDASDFRLRPTSPALNGGHPETEHEDLDGTRNDQGYAGGPAGNLRTAAWYPIPDLPEPIFNMAVAACGGELYLVGGITDGGTTRTVFAYDPGSDAWRQLADYAGPEIRSATAAEMDGYIYVMGGYPASDRVWRFDPKEEVWLERSPMPSPRLHCSVTAVAGQIYVLGGRSLPAWQYHNTAFVYDPTLDERGGSTPWQVRCAAELNTPLGDNTSINVNGEIFTFGSYEPAVPDRVMHYSPSRGRWRELLPSPLVAGANVVRLGNQLFLAEGASNNFWSWDPVEVLPRVECLASEEPPWRASLSSYGMLDFQSQPQVPGPGASRLVAMSGLIYALGAASPITGQCWVFDRGVTEK